MSEFKNIKIVGYSSDVVRSATGLQSNGNDYENINLLDLTQLAQSWSGGIKSSTTSLSASVCGSISAYGYALGGLVSTSGAALTATAFLTVVDDNLTQWRIPLFH